MDAIIDYLDNIFSPLPKSQQITQLKEELLVNMEEKYLELKQTGKTENEAVGIVISEFGNIDEIIEEFSLDFETESQHSLPVITENEAFSFIAESKKSSKIIGFCSSLFIIGAAFLGVILQLSSEQLLFNLSEGTALFVGLTAIFIIFITAVVLLTLNDKRMQRYQSIDQGAFKISPEAKKTVEQSQAAFQSTFVTMLIIAIALCVLSTLALILAPTFNVDTTIFGLAVFLAVIATAVFIFIYYGGQRNSYNKLLKKAPSTAQKQHKDPLFSAVTAIIWSLAVFIFLIGGLIYEQWQISMYVFPITAILFVAVVLIYAGKSKNQKRL